MSAECDEIERRLAVSSAALGGRRLRPLVGRHLSSFTCDGCGERRHGSAVVVMSEVTYCTPCVLVMTANNDEHYDDENSCPHCWPTICPADGTVIRDLDDHYAHVEAAHA